MQDQTALPVNNYTADPPAERLNDQQCAGSTHKRRPGSKRCYCGVFTYSTRKYLPHQNGREQTRRLKQLARGQLRGGVSLEALVTAALVRQILAVAAAEAACDAYLSELTYWHAEGPEFDPGRAYLLGAVRELGRFVRGEPEHDTVTTSALIGLPEPVAPLDRDGDDDLALLQD